MVNETDSSRRSKGLISANSNKSSLVSYNTIKMERKNPKGSVLPFKSMSSILSRSGQFLKSSSSHHDNQIGHFTFIRKRDNKLQPIRWRRGLKNI